MNVFGLEVRSEIMKRLGIFLDLLIEIEWVCRVVDQRVLYKYIYTYISLQYFILMPVTNVLIDGVNFHVRFTLATAKEHCAKKYFV